MHLADGIVNDPVLVTGLNLVGAGSIGVALRHTVDEDARGIAWTGCLAAFVFAAQMINVPLVPGASAHVIGASLLALTVGPARAVVAMGAVVLTQALLLADGGLLVLGINLLNIAVLPVLAVAAAQRLFGSTERGMMTTAVVGTTLGNALGATCLALTLIAGADAPVAVTVPWLLGVQTLAGLVEGILVAGVVRALSQLPDGPPVRLSPTQTPQRSGVSGALAWGAVAVGVLLALSPLATATPDALERVLLTLESER